jgi:hypothetical protein
MRSGVERAIPAEVMEATRAEVSTGLLAAESSASQSSLFEDIPVFTTTIEPGLDAY